jgi:hypothetical protein
VGGEGGGDGQANKYAGGGAGAKPLPPHTAPRDGEGGGDATPPRCLPAVNTRPVTLRPFFCGPLRLRHSTCQRQGAQRTQPFTHTAAHSAGHRLKTPRSTCAQTCPPRPLQNSRAVKGTRSLHSYGRTAPCALQRDVSWSFSARTHAQAWAQGTGRQPGASTHLREVPHALREVEGADAVEEAGHHKPRVRGEGHRGNHGRRGLPQHLHLAAHTSPTPSTQHSAAVTR